MDISIFLFELDSKLNTFEVDEATKLCSDFKAFLLQSNELISLNKAEKVLAKLRNKRLFLQMQEIADTLIQTNRASHKIQRQYGQAMIDLGNYTGAVAVLERVIANTNNADSQYNDSIIENSEAKGLIGRVYKQMYVVSNNPSNQLCQDYITKSIQSYYEVYKKDESKLWHGINTVALLERAKRDKIEINNLPDPLEMAQNILSFIEKKYDKDDADAWDFATAAEACIALGKNEESLRWFSGYARMRECDAFELASTLRQLEEVWQLDTDSVTGQLLLPILRAELMMRSGGSITLDIDEIKKQKALEYIVSSKYKILTEKSHEETVVSISLEKVFGEDSFKTYKWYMTGADRCLTVARIGTDATKGFGTGFLLRGSMIWSGWNDDLVLMTNAHVISNDPAQKALSPNEAVIIFETLSLDEEFTDLKIIWSSPSNELDTTILRFPDEDLVRLQQLTKSIPLYPISKHIPLVEDPPTQKIYIIGHPAGGTLQLSFQDNLMIDHDQICKIHYRTPTEGGSSGSPVFNQQWQLIGIHHAGSTSMQKFPPKEGCYQANEGILINSIKAAIKQQFELNKL